ncbi:hypothetical protein G3A43_06525 [Paraburkholderia aspalathi]|nr:hypothetical protein [Paraburkholderia aspalathi]MBK3779904.1 hypothetical protein [Paraburkholderia aspalathi]
MQFRSISALAALASLSACVVAPLPGAYAPYPPAMLTAVPAGPVVMPYPPIRPIVPVGPIAPVPVVPDPLIEPFVTEPILLPPAVVIREGHEWHAPGRAFGWRAERDGSREGFGRGFDHPPMH